MPPKFYPPKPRKRGYYTKRGKGGLPRYKKAVPYAASQLQAVVRRAIVQNNNKMLETKTACYSTTDGNQISHNNFITLTTNVLATTQGTNDPTTSNQNCRIGDEIALRGASLKFMIELNERYSDVTFRLFVVKCAKGDTPTRSTLFNGLSGNKMLDTINTERYTILFQKYIKIKAPNMVPTSTSGTTAEVSDGLTNAGIEYTQTANMAALSRATRIVKVWIPGFKFVKSGKIKYEDNSSQTKFFDYHVLLYAYSNYTTAQDLWNVARISDYIQQIYFKDG